MAAEISPVNAPSCSQWQFWANTPISVPASAWTASASDTYGGQTTTSTSSGRSSSRSTRQNSAVSTGPLNIFQLPAISMARAYSSTGNRGDTRQLATLEQLERGPAAGRDPRDAIGDAGVMDGADGVSPAHDCVTATVGDRPRDGERPLGEARPLEDAHRPVPEHRLRTGDLLGERVARARADVEPEPPCRQLVERHDLGCRVGVEGVGGDNVGRQHGVERERILATHVL